MPAKEEIKVMLARKNLSLRKLVDLINEKYSRQDTVQNLSKKLTRDSIRYREVEEIAETLGYKIEFLPF
jgi:flagellar biosynthesis component FlhA